MRSWELKGGGGEGEPGEIVVTEGVHFITAVDIKVSAWGGQEWWEC